MLIYRLFPSATSSRIELDPDARAALGAIPLGDSGAEVDLRWAADRGRTRDTDFPSPSDWIPLVSAWVVERFGDVLRTAGHLVPVRVEGKSGFFLYQVTVVAPESFDPQLSVEPRFRGGVSDVPCFVPGKVPDGPAFRLADRAVTAVYWRGEFVRELFAAGVRGVSPHLQWSDEPDRVGAPRPPLPSFSW